MTGTINHINNLRIILTLLVMAHHVANSLGEPGSWYFATNELHGFSKHIFTVFIANNQSFFMGAFFLLSGFFAQGSILKKGIWIFLRDRAFRLLVPLAIFYFFLSPITLFLIYTYTGEAKIGFLQYLSEGCGRGIGPPWFLAALFIFSLLHCLAHFTGCKPRIRNLTQFIMLLGLVIFATFLVRGIFPIGYVWPPLEFQFAYFAQYIVCYFVGAGLFTGNMKEPKVFIKPYLAGLISINLSIVLLLTLIFTKSKEPFLGNLTPQSLFFASYEQIAGISFFSCLYFFVQKYTRNSNFFLKNMVRSSFAAYLIHPPIVVAINIGFRNQAISPFFKFGLEFFLAGILMFAIGRFLTSIPVVRKIL